MKNLYFKIKFRNKDSPDLKICFMGPQNLPTIQEGRQKDLVGI